MTGGAIYEEFSAEGLFVRDDSGNAYTVRSLAAAASTGSTAPGRRVARLPFIELGEAHYLAQGDFGFRGSYENVKSIGQLGFTNHKRTSRPSRPS